MAQEGDQEHGAVGGDSAIDSAQLKHYELFLKIISRLQLELNSFEPKYKQFSTEFSHDFKRILLIYFMNAIRKLQVFVSSTYTDMRDERQAAVEAILEAGHIPAGMELFTANDESQWGVIRRWIDESSLFLIILGDRYGTVDEKTGLSYIEMEFNYAKRTGKTIVALAMSQSYLAEKRKKLVKIAKRKLTSENVSEFNKQVDGILELQNKDKLESFRQSARKKRMAPECDTLGALKLHIVKSLDEIASRKKALPAWIYDTPESRLSLSTTALGMNLRGVSILQSIKDAGLMDIENRSIEQNQLPPKSIYKSVSREILLTGITLKYTLDMHQELLESILDASKKVFLLMLNPNSRAASAAESSHVGRAIDLVQEGKSVVRTIQKLGYLKHPNFQLRFVEEIPPFTGVLVDGNLEMSVDSSDSNGIVRVQPRPAFGIQHKGVVMVFRKVSGLDSSAFDFFASDLRNQWAKASNFKRIPKAG